MALVGIRIFRICHILDILRAPLAPAREPVSGLSHRPHGKSKSVSIESGGRIWWVYRTCHACTPAPSASSGAGVPLRTFCISMLLTDLGKYAGTEKLPQSHPCSCIMPMQVCIVSRSQAHHAHAPTRRLVLITTQHGFDSTAMHMCVHRLEGLSD